MSADERREQILQAAMTAFAHGGLDGTSADVIAERAGISQPYLFRLFGTKKDLFIAAFDRRFTQVLESFRVAAADPPDGLTELEAMGAAYVDLLADRDALRCQLHAYAASHDPDIRAHAQAAYAALWREVKSLSGADEDAVREFFATGMLLTVAAAIDLPEIFLEPGWAERYGES